MSCILELRSACGSRGRNEHDGDATRRRACGRLVHRAGALRWSDCACRQRPFPPERRGASLRSGVGRAILFGACAVSALALLVGAAAACAVLPWPAAVIGAGAAMLA